VAPALKELDEIYLQILTYGLIAIRNAAAAGDSARLYVEADHLHNLPSLVGEPNIQRHLYYATAERAAYLDRLKVDIGPNHSDITMRPYESLWARLDSILGIESK
jgi:hypothetical protein